MAINVSAWSIRNPLATLLLSVTLIVLGIQSFRTLPITRLPNVDLPVISVTIRQFGAAPAELESQVTKSVEDAVSGIEGIKHISSSITDWLSTTTITFQLGTDTDRALNNVKDAVARIRPGLPRNVDEPLVQRVDVVGLTILTYAVIAPGKTPEDVAWFVDDVVTRALQSIRGVGRIERIGGAEREILVSLDPTRLRAVGLTASDVSRVLRATNADVAGGRAEIGQNDQAIRTLAGARTVDALAATRLGLPRGGAVHLDDLGEVIDTVAEPRTFARLDGKPVVGFGIWRSKGASEVAVAEAVAARIADLAAANPDVQFKLIDTSVEFTRGNYEAAMSTLYEGATLAVVIVFLFLRDLRATIIAVIALPLSILPTFWVMSLFGFTLNRVSLMAITLSTGILVDDAIVEIENIVRHMRMGKSAYQAALDASQEIGLTVIAISLTIVAVFIPTSFLSSVIGQLFKEFGITVAIQVLLSLMVARLVTPMLAAYFMRAPRRQTAHDESPGRLSATYARGVSWSVRRRYLAVLIGILLFVGSLWSTRLLPSGFMPEEDTARTLLGIELPPGSQLADTEAVSEFIAKRLRERPEVQSVFVDGGRTLSGLPEVRKATLFIREVPRSQRSTTQRELERAFERELDAIPDIRYWFLNEENGQRSVKLIVTGPNDEEVAAVANDMAAQMQRMPAFSNALANVAVDRPEVRIQPRPDLAARFGVVTESLADTIRVATIGDVGPNLAYFNAGDRLVPVRVLLKDSTRADPQAIEQVGVPTAQHTVVPLSLIADIQFGHGPITINRWDRSRQASVEADLSGTTALSDAMAQLRSMPVMKSLSTRVHIEDAGDAEQLQELMEGFQSALRNGLMMVFAVLVLLFKSLLQPLTILVSLPLSVGGTIVGLVATDKPINMPVLVGILMLMGIVTKNAIMLVDFALEAMAAGIDRAKAIVEACLKRARPIVMTTVAMVGGMLPSAFGIGAGGEFRSPMAIAVISGLIVSTFLSLLFVPAFFSVMDDLGRALRRVFGRFVEAHDEADPPAGQHEANLGTSVPNARG
jgi:hydrophobe/amphiphile efflux-1 (HAE1) family protein